MPNLTVKRQLEIHNQSLMLKMTKSSFNYKINLQRPTPTLDPSSSNFCKLVQDAIDEFILGTEKDKRAIRFSPFATSDPSNWTQIINSGSQPEISNVNGVCKSVRIGATIQIAYALVGNVANPQSELQFISYDWNEKTDIIITCQPGQFCIDINNLMIKVSTRVIFVDVSQPPLYAESQMARPQTTLPGDFFYPIINSSVRSIDKIYFMEL
ncbi:tectonic-1-like isoform X5 [Brachionus plicatilis]|uniref:Tectonic-1-like isoform X5 n=1 Tax=Brachionus plicatilis TaxID=10195 RepID=A0A3M7RBB1_BRAPC|nr:tectonic-1-like isoform X5 [Brachionus plicatilis]